jgi:hypothetical protein
LKKASFWTNKYKAGKKQIEIDDFDSSQESILSFSHDGDDPNNFQEKSEDHCNFILI